MVEQTFFLHRVAQTEHEIIVEILFAIVVKVVIVLCLFLYHIFV